MGRMQINTPPVAILSLISGIGEFFQVSRRLIHVVQQVATFL